MEKVTQTDTAAFRFNRVMLIDDTFLDNFINKKIIETTAFAKDIDVRMDGLSAFESLRDLDEETRADFLPDVIFVDLNMPVMDGFQFIRKFYTLPEIYRDKCRIVILTSSVNESDRETAMGINPKIIFINKPLFPEDLALIL
ncbi:MAG: response regulator [Bacteroidia bacterium]